MKLRTHAAGLRRAPVVTLLGALMLVLGLAGPGGVAAAPGADPHARAVTSWPFVPPLGGFAESMALGRDGALYTSLTTWGKAADTARIVRVWPATGQRAPFGPRLQVGQGLAAGVAVDAHGRLYVAEATFGADPAPGIVRIDRHGALTRVATLPAASFPNGVAVRRGWVYVSDPALGVIWRMRAGAHDLAVSKPWLANPLLAPTHDLGANGIAFRGRQLWIAVSDTGRILRVRVHDDGTPGALHSVLQRPRLVTVDGIAFDVRGRLWMTTNGPATGRLLRLTPPGDLVVVANHPSWLDYPTQPVLGTTPRTAGSLFVANGSFDNGTPSIVALAAGTRGVLP